MDIDHMGILTEVNAAYMQNVDMARSRERLGAFLSYFAGLGDLYRHQTFSVAVVASAGSSLLRLLQIRFGVFVAYISK